MLKHRLITGPLLSAAIIALLYFDNQIGVIHCECGTIFQGGLLIAILGVLISPLVAIELGAIGQSANLKSSILTLLLTMEAWILSFYLLSANVTGIEAIGLFGSIFIGSFVLALCTLSMSRDLKGVISGACFTTASASYIAIAIGFLLLLRREHDAMWILGIIAIVKMCDTGAFYFGCNFGKHKLIPWISPAKTWEGLIGGVITAALTAWGLAALNNAWLDEPIITTSQALLYGSIFGILGQVGDLTISIFKRDSGLKDSSTALPGLGGVLDVIDSLLLVSPVAYWMLRTT